MPRKTAVRRHIKLYPVLHKGGKASSAFPGYSTPARGDRHNAQEIAAYIARFSLLNNLLASPFVIRGQVVVV